MIHQIGTLQLTRFQEQEDAMLDDNSRLHEQSEKQHSFISPIHTAFSAPDEKLDYALFLHQNTIFWKLSKLNAKTHLSILALKTDQCKAHVGPVGNQHIFCQVNHQCNDQCRLHTILHPTLSRHFHTNDRQLCYRRIGHDMFMDTLEARTTTCF